MSGPYQEQTPEMQGPSKGPDRLLLRQMYGLEGLLMKPL